MGCLGSVPGIPSAPEIELDMEAVGEAITDAVKAIPGDIETNKRDFPGELRACQDDEWEVPDTGGSKLKKNATEDEIWLAAIMSACGGAVKSAIGDSIWAQFEPKIDEQLDAVEGLPDRIKTKAKDTFREKTVDPLVDAAVDKCLEAAKKAISGDENEENTGLAAANAVEEENPNPADGGD